MLQVQLVHEQGSQEQLGLLHVVTTVICAIFLPLCRTS
jgi:hypothetical protein